MQFVVSNRRAGKFRETEKRASRAALNVVDTVMTQTTHMVSDFVPADDLARRTMILEGSQSEMMALDARTDEDVIVEPLILHKHDNALLGAFSAFDVIRTDSSFPSSTANPVSIQVSGRGQPLDHASVYLIVRALNGQNRVFEGVTNAAGEAVFNLSALYQPLFCVVVPYDGFWAMRAMVSTSSTRVVCPPLPSNQRLDWWHRDTGGTSYDERAGEGIRVGVIDTGFGPHGHLSGTDEGAFIGNTYDPGAGADVDNHGTHVCGTIAGRPGEERVHAGVAPGVTLHSVRVFPPDSGASNVDIANAIDFLSRDRQCDLINMSLGAPSPSIVIQDAIQDALERGTLSVCAAANSSGPVEYPAAFPEAVAISAAGKLGEAPTGSVSASKLPNDPDLFGLDRLFFADFSCFGPEIDAIAPGVGIIAAVPERHGRTTPYAALDGTSMACPTACGVLARALARNKSYCAMPRDLHRTAMARAILGSICRPVGLPRINEGAGMPVE